MTTIDRIIAFETGEIDDTEFLNLFSELIRTGQAWSLQGFYGRTAQQLIENQIISTEGEIL
jgi:hypothetical protein